MLDTICIYIYIYSCMYYTHASALLAFTDAHSTALFHHLHRGIQRQGLLLHRLPVKAVRTLGALFLHHPCKSALFFGLATRLCYANLPGKSCTDPGIAT